MKITANGDIWPYIKRKYVCGTTSIVLDLVALVCFVFAFGLMSIGCVCVCALVSGKFQLSLDLLPYSFSFPLCVLDFVVCSYVTVVVPVMIVNVNWTGLFPFLQYSKHTTKQ